MYLRLSDVDVIYHCSQPIDSE